MNSMVSYVNYTKQGMIGLQDKFIESENERLKQSIFNISTDPRKISTKKSLHQLLYVLNDVNIIVKQ